jgi:hypothetical protein
MWPLKHKRSIGVAANTNKATPRSGMILGAENKKKIFC